MYSNNIIWRKLITKSTSIPSSLAVLLTLSFVMVRFGKMQLDGLPQAGAAVIALAIATASLLFNRARALPSGPHQRRTLMAAEYCLQAVVLILSGSAILAAGFYFLMDNTYEPINYKSFDFYFAPFFIASIPSLLLGFAANAYFTGLKIMFRSVVVNITPRTFLRSIKTKKF